MILHIPIARRGETMWGIPWESLRTQWYYVPNLLSYARIALSWVPAYLLVASSSDAGARLAALGWFVLIAATDWLDGFLARKLKQQSAWGMFVDPLGDKLLVACSVTAILYVGWNAPFGWLLVLTVWVIFAREFTLTAEIRIAQDSVIMPPTLLGKSKTVVQFVMIGTWFLAIPGSVGGVINLLVLLVTLAVTVASWVQYRKLYVTSGRISH